ncbi:MAG: GNAT family N-acetyltransferase [Solirubrobacterales bacterium]|nr:GNAT family N-acetyltransferase [Solirubrobacterales bacterium]
MAALRGAYWLRRLDACGQRRLQGAAEGRAVEIGYSVVPSWQRQGLATEACRALIESAWRRGAEVVIAHTLAGLEPSIAVLRKLRFAAPDSTEPGVLAFALGRRESSPSLV